LINFFISYQKKFFFDYKKKRRENRNPALQDYANGGVIVPGIFFNPIGMT